MISGQLGQGAEEQQEFPLEFSFEKSLSNKSSGIAKVEKIVCSGTHTLILTSKSKKKEKNFLSFFLKN
jgi:predicted  nucleic acid-binding Zn-ribbon protein